MNDEYLERVTIGPREPLNSGIQLEPYDPRWAMWYSRLAARVATALGEKVVQLEHVGSTSVPGLSAKPIIDMVLAVADSRDEPSYVPPLEAAGFLLRIREPDFFQHRLFKSSDVAANLHVFSADCPEIQRMVAFRDWLSAHEGDRRLYEETKRELAARVWRHVQNYADAKSEVVGQILSRALGPSPKSA